MNDFPRFRAYLSRPDRVWRSRREQCKARRQGLLVVKRGGATPQCDVDRMPYDGSAYWDRLLSESFFLEGNPVFSHPVPQCIGIHVKQIPCSSFAVDLATGQFEGAANMLFDNLVEGL